MKKLITITILSFTIVWGLQRPTTRPSGRPSSRLEYQQLQAQKDKDSLHFVFEPDSLFLHLGETGEVTVKLLNQDNELSKKHFLFLVDRVVRWKPNHEGVIPPGLPQ